MLNWVMYGCHEREFKSNCKDIALLNNDVINSIICERAHGLGSLVPPWEQP